MLLRITRKGGGTMKARHFLIPALLLLIAASFGCGPKIPREIEDRVSWKGDFKTLQAEPEAFIDEFVILGGRIVRTENFEDHSEITVVQFPTDRSNRPQPEKPSGGRFLVRSDAFADPAIHAPGKLITVAGRVAGSETRAIGDYPYEHPIIQGDVWVWEPGTSRTPRIQFGVGIGKTF